VPEDVAAAHPLDVPEATRPLRARPAPAKRAEPSVAWVDAIGAVCPPTHPIKAKLTSRIYHVPGGQNYTRTRPDRCYADEAGAQADGLRKAQR
jgi:micrococcal nuclease